MSLRQRSRDSLDKASVPIATLVERYLSDCHAAGMTPNTLRGYREELTRYVRVTAGTPGDFTLATLRGHLARLQTA
jgi:hypothetical protein